MRDLTGPFCLPHAAGALWREEYGLYVRTETEAGRVYDHASAWRARWCGQHGIPTGLRMSREAVTAINEACRLAAYPERADPLWAEARRLLAEAQDAQRRRIAPLREAGEWENPDA